ncbi:MAG: zonular occludens toxin domain-containing protein [Acidobacteriaceae bacterium]
MIYLLYGQPGTGKSTLATGIALDYLRQGRRVVANYPIDAAPASYRRTGRMADAFVTVVPSRPSFQHISDLGLGWVNPQKDAGREDLAGLLLIDEAGPWLDSRRWQDSDRPKIIDWLLQSRKRGWDVLVIAQAPGLIDKQIREAVIEGYCRIRRSDRMKFLNFIRLPRFHIGIVRYGQDANAPILERYVFRGRLEHKCYGSYSLFSAENDTGPYCTLPARLTKWANPKPSRFFCPPPPRPAPRPKLPHIERLMALHPDARLAALRILQSSPASTSPLSASA